MAISPLESGSQLIQKAEDMTAASAQTINQSAQESLRAPEMPQDKLVPEKERPSEDQIQALIDLQQANQYAKIGTNMIQRDQEMIGSVLDLRV